jgi:nucleoside-diphosphate-sugar epimerase
VNISIIGSNGFVGKNLVNNLITSHDVNEINIHYPKEKYNDINSDIVIHLSGKSHDLLKVINEDDYYIVNTEFAKLVFDDFINSNARVFIIMSSVKAAADFVNSELTEEYLPNPKTHYGKSKLLAERYIQDKQIPIGKRIYILRPCMIHGPGNKGNLNLLYNIVIKGFPWPLGSFDNKRSFCSINNLCFIINELIQNDKIPSGVYNIADDEALSTNDLVRLIADSVSKKPFILNIPKFLVKSISKLGDVFKLPLNTERLNKLTETYIVSNKKIKNAINKPLPVSATEGLVKTFNSFNNVQ